MLSLMGPNDLKVWLGGGYKLGKEYSRGFLHNQHTYESPLELFKYFWKDPDGVAGTNVVAAAILDPGKYDTSLRTKKSTSESFPVTATHSALMLERRSVLDQTAAHDILLEEVTLKMIEGRVWFELYLKNDQLPCTEGLVTEFPPGFGPEGDFTTDDERILRTGMNNLSAVTPLPMPVKLEKDNIINAILRPVHGALALPTNSIQNVGCAGVRAIVHWFQ
jgi:hypothetical protein